MWSHGSHRTGNRINSKHEIRNSKQIQMHKSQKTLNEPVLDFKFFPSPIPMGEGQGEGDFVSRSGFVSDFDIRISDFF